MKLMPSSNHVYNFIADVFLTVAEASSIIFYLCRQFFAEAKIFELEKLEFFTIQYFPNFVWSKVITVDDRDPPWRNEEIKSKMKSKNKTIQQYLKNGRKWLIFKLQIKKQQNRKEKYFYDLSLKLNNSQSSPKSYWSIIKSCHNSIKILIITLLSVNGKIVTNF